VRAADIDRWHRERGFNEIGYHFVISDGGAVERGRHISKVGAHAKGRNRHSIGICYAGGFQPYGNGPQGPNAYQVRTLEVLCECLLAMFPNAKIIGHRDTGALKDCPSFSVERWLRDGSITEFSNRKRS
jgi:N-acetylmuramoyl-L-alanine amidase